MRTFLNANFFAACLLVGSPTADAAASDCQTLDACVTSLRALAKIPVKYDSMLTPDEDALNKHLLSFDGAVPRLIPLLADPDGNVASIAAAALRNAAYIDPKYLPQIKAGLDRHLGWLAPALARMPSDEAAREAVARLLVSKSAPENQEAYAVELSGRRAIPFIVEAARCRNGCSANQYALGVVLGRMGAERSQAASGLIAIAQDPSVPRPVAMGALEMIGALREEGRAVESQLLALRSRSPDLAHAIDDALIGVRSDRAGDIFSERLRSGADIVVLRDLADTGTAGRAAGPALVRLLEDTDWDIRIAAARTIGYIGYEQGSGALIGALNNPADVRLTWAAAQSLGRLRATSAGDALRGLARDHWYTPVRQAAVLALRNIETGSAYPKTNPRGNFAIEFFDYEYLGRGTETCNTPLVSTKHEAADHKLYSDQSAESVLQLEKLAYAVTIRSYGPATVPAPKPSAEPQIIEVTPDNMVEHRRQKMQVPHVALRVDNGWLTGSNRGEWGGELTYVDDKGTTQEVLTQNVEDVYLLGKDVVAVTGLAHMMMNHGMIYKVSRHTNGTWIATPWRALPGAPESSSLVDTGELLVNAVDGGSILISADGTMRMVPCAASK